MEQVVARAYELSDGSILMPSHLTEVDPHRDWTLPLPTSATTTDATPAPVHLDVARGLERDAYLWDRINFMSGDRWSYVVPARLPPLADVDTVWHYTDAAGLIGILESQQLWASSPVSLNDSQEMHFGLDLLAQRIADLQPELTRAGASRLAKVLDPEVLEEGISKIYVLSASLDGDLLNQWRGYAGNGGYSLGLATAGVLGPATEDINPGSKPGAMPGWWYAVQYDEPDQLRLLDDVVRYALAEPNVDSIASVALTSVACIKHGGFRDEREARYVVAAPQTGQVRFRAGPGGRVVPFLSLSAGPSRDELILAWHLLPQQVAALPLTKIMLGPGGPGHEYGVSRLLEELSYVSVPVARSEVPFRGSAS